MMRMPVSPIMKILSERESEMEKITELTLSGMWERMLLAQPETGMGYQVCDVVLKDGHVYKGVVICNTELVTKVPGVSTIPFREADIEDIRVTHEKG